VCAFAYIATFLTLPVDNLLPWSLLLFGGWFANIVAIYALEWPHLDGLRLTREQFMRDMPGWVNWCEIALAIILGGHFLWMLRKAGPGVPAIVDGQYVVESRGRILRVITESDYLQLKCLMDRMFAVLFFSLYFILTMYWWSHKTRRVLR